ncbi:hypothetical protein Tco_0863106 [Tanacetum coccineum]
MSVVSVLASMETMLYLLLGIALCLLRRLAVPYLLRRLVVSYLLRRLAAPYLLKRLAAPYLLRKLVGPYLLRRLAVLYLLRRLVAPYLLRRLARPYLLRRLTAHYLLRRLAGPYLPRRLAAPYLLRRLAAPYLLRRLTGPYLLRRLAAPYLLRRLVGPYLLRRLDAPNLPRRLAGPYNPRRLAAPYLLRRLYSLVISSRPEVAFVTPAIPVDHSNMEWFPSVVFRSVVLRPEVHEECLRRRITRSVSIKGSRVVSPSEDHEECLYRRITRSVSIGGSLHWSITRSASIRGSRGVSPSEDHKECLHRRFTRSVSIRGSRGVSLSESTRSVSIRVPIIVDFLGPTSLKVHTLELPQILLEYSTKGFHWRRSFGSIRGDSSGKVPLVLLEVALLFQSEVVSRELIVVARPEVARPKLVVARPEVARPKQFVTRSKVARPELVVALLEVARPELVVARPEVARPELIVARPEVARPELVVARLEVEVRTTVGDKIGKELLHLAPSPYYMLYPYDEGLSSHPPNMKGEWSGVHAVKLGIMKKELFKYPKVRKSDNVRDFQPNANNQPMILRSKTLIIVRVDEQEAQFPVHVEHLSVELARPKEANHALEKANHGRCKKYKKYKAKRDSLVLEKERLENELLEILAASIKKFKIHKLKNVIIERKRDLF